MVEQPRAWRLERNGNTVFAAVCAEFACYAEDSGPTGGAHRNPAWHLGLPWDGPITAVDETGRTITGAGLLVPPGLLSAVEHAPGITALWIDPHRLAIPGTPRIHALTRSQAQRLLTAITDDFDPERLRHTVHRIFGGSPLVDPRLQQVLQVLDHDVEIDELADRVGLSPRRLRQLSGQLLGGPLVKLRRWHRLREAGLQLPFLPAAEVAARTGFADQSHLIRTMVALCGRTPTSSAVHWR
ncbi:AraC family transcriptional regulator [Nocardia crassostreae]|uniref:AraC family transcriptional regulator n=1 Tax=Nocardia crassostreae TaxID=53428 RepID=UPI0009FC3085|nr:AraC family transcriptional regulator [Nocardia crassostreae]